MKANTLVEHSADCHGCMMGGVGSSGVDATVDRSAEERSGVVQVERLRNEHVAVLADESIGQQRMRKLLLWFPHSSELAHSILRRSLSLL